MRDTASVLSAASSSALTSLPEASIASYWNTAMVYPSSTIVSRTTSSIVVHPS